MTERGITPPQTAGPYLRIGLLRNILTPNVVDPADPRAIRIRGRLTDSAGDGVPDGMIETGRVPWPEGGMQAPHIGVTVFARGLLKHAVTRLYFPDEAEANAEDPVLSRLRPEQRETLVAVAEDGGLRFDICLQG